MIRMRFHVGKGWLGLGLFLVTSGLFATTTPYTTTPNSTNPGTGIAVRYAVINLDLPDGTQIYPFKVNNNGQVLMGNGIFYNGWDKTQEWGTRTFLWSQGTAQEITGFQGVSDLGDDGTIVGTAPNPNYQGIYITMPWSCADSFDFWQLQPSSGIAAVCLPGATVATPLPTPAVTLSSMYFSESYIFQQSTGLTIDHDGKIYGTALLEADYDYSDSAITDGVVWATPTSSPVELGTINMGSNGYNATGMAQVKVRVRNGNYISWHSQENPPNDEQGGNFVTMAFTVNDATQFTSPTVNDPSGYYSGGNWSAGLPVAINDYGEAIANYFFFTGAGWVPPANSVVPSTLYLDDGSTQTLGMGVNANSINTGVSGYSDVVGDDGATTFRHAVIWSRDSTLTGVPDDGSTYHMRRLDDCVPQGWAVTGAISINDSGVIVGTATSAADGQYHGVMLIPAELAVDADRNGTIVLANDVNNPANLGLPVDQTSQAKPFRFWVNSFDETNEQDNPDSTYQDSVSTTIVDQRDLENFARLWIYNKVPSGFFGSTKVQIGLKWKSVTGAPSIRLFRSYDPNGGTSYVTDGPTATAIANDQTGKYSQCVSDKNNLMVVSPTSSPADFIFADGIDNNTYSPTTPKKYFIFEGVGIGKGELVLVYLDSTGKEIGEGPGVWFDLENIKTLYKSSDADQFQQAPDETHDAIVFVHGWNMSPSSSRTFAEDMFKRLWHRGFKGRFCYFRWATGNSTWFTNYVPVIGQDIDAVLANYNGSEYNAWHTGQALNSFINSAVPNGYTKNLAAHSMGNIVAGSGMINGLQLNHYAMLQAAVPSCCYDASAARQQTQSVVVNYTIAGVSVNIPLWASKTPDSDLDPGTANLAYRGCLAGYAGNHLFSFYQPDDEAAGYYWNANNAYFKPTINYHYNPNGNAGQKLYSGINTWLTDRLQAMPYADQSWSKTAGTDARTAGAVGGGINNETSYGFNSEHSAEFNFDIQDLKSFYNDLLNSFGIQFNP